MVLKILLDHRFHCAQKIVCKKAYSLPESTVHSSNTEHYIVLTNAPSILHCQCDLCWGLVFYSMVDCPPGNTELKRTPCFPCSRARLHVRASSAALATQYAGISGIGITAAKLEMHTTAP